MLSLPFHLPRKTRFQVYLPLLAWGFFIFFLSSQPSLPSPSVVIWDFAFKKLAHMFVYFVFFRLMFRAVQFDVTNQFKATAIALLLSIIYSMSDELHQSFIPGRTPTGKDVLFDILGMGIAWLTIFKYV
ncbi:MAG: VanZ family protein [Patescibacteria group bacterium]